MPIWMHRLFVPLYRSTPHRYRPVVRAIVSEIYCQCSNVLWRIRNPRLWWNVRRRYRLMMQTGRIEIDA